MTATRAAAQADSPAPVPAEKILQFPGGLFGFKDTRRFLVSAVPGTGDAFTFLHCIDDPAVGFTLADPRVFFADYAPRATAADLEEVGLEGPEQAIWLVIATVPQDFRQTTVNLKAPLLINPFRRLAKQVILAEDYAVRQPLFPA